MNRLKHILFVVLTILFCYIVQSVLLPLIAISAITPNLMLIAVVTFGFIYGEKKGILTGFICGLLCDIFFGPAPGYTALLYSLIGFICGHVRRLLYMQGIGFPIIAITVCDLFYGFLNFVFLFLIRNRIIFGQFFFEVMLPESIYTAVLGIVFYPLLMLIYEKAVQDSGRVVLLVRNTDDSENSAL